MVMEVARACEWLTGSRSDAVRYESCKERRKSWRRNDSWWVYIVYSLGTTLLEKM